MIQRWTAQEIAFIKENLHLSDRQMAEQLGRTPMAVRNKRQGIRKRYVKVNASQWTQGQKAAYKDLWQHHTDTQLADHYGVSRKAICEINNLMGLQRERNIKSEPLKAKLQTGAITTRMNKGKPYKWIRTEAGWTPYHTFLWLQAGRQIPDKHAVTFIDGDTANCTLDNLTVKTKWQIHIDANPDVIERRNATRRANYQSLTPEEKKEQYLRYLETKRAAQRRYKERILAATAPQREAKRQEREAKRIERQKAEQRLKRSKAAKKRAKRKEAERIKAERQAKRTLNIDKAWAQQAKQNKKREKTYTVKAVDLSEKVAVKINAKTWVYVNKGADIEKVIAKYKQAS